METLAILLLAAVIGALIHRYRGGGFDLPRSWPREFRGTSMAEYLVGPTFGAAVAGQYLVAA
jgi:hypothetical protein